VALLRGRRSSVGPSDAAVSVAWPATGTRGAATCSVRGRGFFVTCFRSSSGQHLSGDFRVAGLLDGDRQTSREKRLDRRACRPRRDRGDDSLDPVRKNPYSAGGENEFWKNARASAIFGGHGFFGANAAWIEGRRQRPRSKQVGCDRRRGLRRTLPGTPSQCEVSSSGGIPGRAAARHAASVRDEGTRGGPPDDPLNPRERPSCAPREPYIEGCGTGDPPSGTGGRRAFFVVAWGIGSVEGARARPAAHSPFRKALVLFAGVTQAISVDRLYYERPFVRGGCPSTGLER